MFDDFVQSSRSAGLEASVSSMPGPSRAGHAGLTALGAAPDVDGDGFELDGPVEPLTALETGFVSSDLDAASLVPIFQLGRVQYAFPAPLALLTVASNILTMCLYSYPSLQAGGGFESAAAQRPRLVRINLDDPERTEEAEVPLPPQPRTRNAPPIDPNLLGPHKMFSDPSGRHLVLSMRSGDNFYWFSGWKKARPLPRLKGLVLESIAWNRAASEQLASSSQGTAVNRQAISSPLSTREILLGTRAGEIYEAVLVAPPGGDLDEGDFLDRLTRRTAGGSGSGPEIDRVLRHVFTLPEQQAATGLAAEPLTGTSKGKGKAVVIITTSTRIYEIIGPLGKGKKDDAEGESLYDPLFEPYRGDAAPPLRSELPGDLPYSELHLWAANERKSPKALAWLTGPGVYHGLLSFAEQEGADTVVDSANLLPYPAVALEEDEAESGANGGSGTVAEIPLSIALTEFHFLLLYRDRIMGISSLDDRVVFEEVLPLKPHERVIAAAVDPSRRTYWVYTDASIFELVVKDEDRDVWRVYLERGSHDTALRYAKTPAQRDMVLSSQGDRFFTEGRFIQAAQCYAQTYVRTFEEIVLRFLDAAENDALRYYLVMRLERLRKADVTQRIMLATWLVEIYLSKINELEDVAAAEAASTNVENYRVEQEMLEEELRQFLVTYKENLDRKTVFNLIGRHGRTNILLHYASVIQDHERIVRHWVQEEGWEQAIEALNRQSSLALYYRFAAVLMRNSPQATVDSWTRQPALEPRRLIPAMLQHKPSSGQANQAVRYLRHVIDVQDNTDAAVHNLLLTLLARGAPHEPREKGDAALLSFIADSRPNPRTGAPCYDLDYALRTCSANGRQEACIRIYAKMGLYESAVDMALHGGDIELACICADMAEGNTSLRRKLWLKGARHVVETEKDIRAAMVFLSRTDLLSIEDILPFFPDFVVIDDFKDEICGALEGYAARIEALKDEMDEAARSADSIRADTANLAKRLVTVEADEKCAVCDQTLLQRQFYVFPCRHSFHADCLIAETTRHLPQRTLRRILELQEQLSSLTSGLIPAPPPLYASALAQVGRVTRKGAGAAASIPFGGLDRLREFILPDAIVGAISAGVSVGVSSGRRVLDPLSASPTDARTTLAAIGQSSADAHGSNGPVPSRKMEEEERIEELRDELDSLVASACVICDGSVNAIARPFISEREGTDEWTL